MITSLDQLDFNKTYTYSDYLSWKFKERVELIRGRIFKMSPAPSTLHQRISMRFNKILLPVLDQRKCEIFNAPFDVFLNRKGAHTVVQPDICVICDPNKLTEQGCTGAPDLIIEILSPGNSRKEMKEKFELYEENGVQEYWLADPGNEDITIYSLNKEGKYIGSKPFVAEEHASSSVIAGFSVVVEEVFRTKN